MTKVVDRVTFDPGDDLDDLGTPSCPNWLKVLTIDEKHPR